MKVLVTGGAGFIGSHLVTTLAAQGHEVFVVDNLSSGKRENIPEGVHFIEGDIRVMDKLQGLPKKVDAIFHLAAQIDVRHSVSDPIYDASVNVQGTIAVLNYAVRADADRVIFSSSGGAIYGSTETIPTHEGIPVSSSSPYGIAKYCAERYIELFSRLHNLHYVVLRYSNVYGPGQSGSRESGVIAIFSELAFSKQPLTIYGDGEQTRDFVYVGDVVRANMAALGTQVQDVFNIATGTETTINELAQLLCEVVPHDVEVGHGPAKKGEERRSCLDPRKAEKYLGWKPTMDLRKGLETTFSHVQDELSKRALEEVLKETKKA
jgi:UDP-glucose 4-epimerase